MNIRKSTNDLRGLIGTLVNSQTISSIFDLGKGIIKIYKDFSQDGLYEVLEYESTLELLDKSGKKAKFQKREKIRYQQNNIIAYQDQAWGDGEILADYRCSPGVPVDQHRPGQKTYVLISLREVKNRDDIDEFNIEWGIKNGFSRKNEQWETDVMHPTKQLKIQIIFPKSRVPIRTMLIENNRQKTRKLGADYQYQLPDGRYMISWEKFKPRLHEKYIIAWSW